eukprot:gene32786-33851_t
MYRRYSQIPFNPAPTANTFSTEFHFASMAAPKAWGTPAATNWADDVDEAEEAGSLAAPLPTPANKYTPPSQVAQVPENDFPSLGEAAKAPKAAKKKKGTTVQLGQFMSMPSGKTSGPAAFRPTSNSASLNDKDILANLPSGPRPRDPNEPEDAPARGGMGGGFKEYGGDRGGRGGGGFADRQERPERRGREGGDEFMPSKADAIDDWATTRTFVPSSGCISTPPTRRDAGPAPRAAGSGAAAAPPPAAQPRGHQHRPARRPPLRRRTDEANEGRRGLPATPRAAKAHSRPGESSPHRGGHGQRGGARGGGGGFGDRGGDGGRGGGGGFDRERPVREGPGADDAADWGGQNRFEPTERRGGGGRGGDSGGGRGGGFGEDRGDAARADGADPWSKGRTFQPTEGGGGRGGGGERSGGGGFGGGGGGGGAADTEDKWSRREAPPAAAHAPPPSAGSRPRLQLAPRSKPVEGAEESAATKSSIFGAARPREEVLKEKGIDVTKEDLKLEFGDVDRPDTQEEIGMAAEIEKLRKALEVLKASGEVENGPGPESIADEVASATSHVDEKEKELYKLKAENDDKVRFAKRADKEAGEREAAGGGGEEAGEGGGSQGWRPSRAPKVEAAAETAEAVVGRDAEKEAVEVNGGSKEVGGGARWGAGRSVGAGRGGGGERMGGGERGGGQDRMGGRDQQAGGAKPGW